MPISVINNSDTPQPREVNGVGPDCGLITFSERDADATDITSLVMQICSNFIPVAAHTEVVRCICHRYMPILAWSFRFILLEPHCSSCKEVHRFCSVHNRLLNWNIYSTACRNSVKLQMSRQEFTLQNNELRIIRGAGTPSPSYQLSTMFIVLSISIYYYYSFIYFLRVREVPTYRKNSWKPLVPLKTVDASTWRHPTGIPT